MGFLVDVQPFSYGGERRYFVVERAGAVVAFRARLRPARWDPIYMAFPGGHRPAPVAGTAALFDALSAFARGRLARFGLQTLAQFRGLKRRPGQNRVQS
jgi:hypothetical protein